MRTATQAPRPQKLLRSQPEGERAPPMASSGSDDVEALLRYARAARAAASHAPPGTPPGGAPPGQGAYVGQEQLGFDNGPSPRW